MKFKFERKKSRQLFVSLVNRLSKLPFMSGKGKLKLFLNLNWIFWRLSLEQADKVYEFSDNSMRNKNLEFLLSKLQSSFKVMDLGCKFGRISNIIAGKTQKVIGVDHDKKAIKIAKTDNKLENLSFFHADAFEYLKDHNDKFDVIILSHILEHLDEPKTFLNKYKSYFDFFYIEVPDIDESYLNHYRHKEKLELIYTDHDHIWEFDRDSFKQLLDESGLVIIDSEYRYGLQKYWCKK